MYTNVEKELEITAMKTEELKSITINAIKENTWIEKAVGNIFTVAADAARIVVESGAKLSRVSLSKAGSNDGTVTAVGVCEAAITAEAGGKSASCKVTVIQADISAAEITLEKTAYEYGTEIAAMNITVKIGDKTLAAGTDYKISTGKPAAGPAAITVSGTGNYKGSKDVTVQIIPSVAVISSTDVKQNSDIAGKNTQPETEYNQTTVNSAVVSSL